MIAELQYVGIDVAKDRLDIHVYPGGMAFSVANSKKGLAGLKARLKPLPVGGIGLEASGGYERNAAQGLAQADLPVHLLDPAQVRAFARSMKTRAKTDAIDAAMIARYVAVAHEVLAVYRPDPGLERLSVLGAYRRKLQDEAKGLKALRDTTQDALVRRMIHKRLDTLACEVTLLAKEIASQIAAAPDLKRKAEQLASLPGVGPVLTATLLADLRELGQIGPKRLASLVGVAPHARQSGKMEKSGKCGGGRKSVRDVLYMATLSAIKARMPHLHPFYARLRADGKPFKVALIATMRKFLTIINAVVRDNSTFKSAAP
jgi:transposase